MTIGLKRPHWLKRRIILNPELDFTKSVLAEFGLNTVCQSAKCPNIFECFSKRTATFLILGRVCTRGCAFCAVGRGSPCGLDYDEPNRIAEAVSILGAGHVVITSVTRDDLADGGSRAFVRTINAIRKKMGEGIEIEVLVPDFRGRKIDIKNVAKGGPDTFSHNIETVPRLYKKVRPGADYNRSLDVLSSAKEVSLSLATKSAFMVGLGETEQEIELVMKDLRAAGCDMLAIGQYLRPSSEQIEVKKFIRPEIFLKYKEQAYKRGFKKVWSGPFIRSSYRPLASE